MKRKFYMLTISVLVLCFAMVQNIYAQEKAWHSGVYQHREGYKQMIFADVGWKWGVNLSTSVFIDLDDMMKTSPDGQAGWVTVWVTGSVGVGVSALPGSVGYVMSNEFGDDGFNDPQVGGAGVSGTFGMTSLSTGTLSTDYTVSVSTNVGVNSSMGTTLLAVEMRKSEIFEIIKNTESTDEGFKLLASHILSRFGRISMGNTSVGIITGAFAMLTDIRDPHWDGDDWDQRYMMLTAYEVQMKEVHETIRNLQYGGESVVSSIDESARYATVNQKALHHGAPMKGKKKYHFFTNRKWSNECYFKLEDFAQGTRVKIHACIIDEENILVDLRVPYKKTVSYDKDQYDVAVIASVDFVVLDDRPIYVTVGPETGGLHHGWIMFEDVTYNNSKAGGQDEYVYNNGEYVKKSEIQYPAPVSVPDDIVLGVELKPMPTESGDEYEYKEQAKTSVPSKVWLGKDIEWFRFSGSNCWAAIRGKTDHFVKGETYDYTNSEFFNAGNGPVLATVLYKHGMSHNNTNVTFKWYKPGASTPCYTGVSSTYRYWGYVGWGMYIHNDNGAGWFPEGEWKCEIYLGSSLTKTVLFDVYDHGASDGRFAFIDPTPKDGSTISGNWNNGQFNITTGVDGFLGGSNELKFFINGKAHQITSVHSPITNESEFIGSSVWNVKDFADGNYTIRAEINSSLGKLSTEERTITVMNTPPTSCSITSPTGGTITSPYKTVTVSASANTDYVEFLVDGQIRGYDTEAPFSKEICLINDNATAELTAVAHNAAGKRTSSVRTINLRCVYISSPEENAHVANNVDIEAKTVGTAPSNVKFYVNGVYKSTDYSSPYTYSWNSTGYSGEIPFKAVAVDASPYSSHEVDAIVGGNVQPWQCCTSETTYSRYYSNGAVIMNGYIYLCGGSNKWIERGKIEPDGSVSSWTLDKELKYKRIAGNAVHTEDYIYIAGGDGGWGLSHPARTSIDRARIYADGSVGEVITLPDDNDLQEPRVHFGFVRSGDYIYAIAGQPCGGSNPHAVTSVEYARIKEDNTLTPWKYTSSLNRARCDFGAVVVNGYIYVLGGGASNGEEGLTNSIERAEIMDDGNLGPWITLSRTITAQSHVKSVVYSNFIYTIHNNKRVECTYIHENNTLGSCEILSPLIYGGCRCFLVNKGVNDAIYAIGGYPESKKVQYTRTGNGPTITNVSSSNISSNSAKITWNTNIPCNSRVDYWTDDMWPNYFSTPVINTLSMVTSHSVTITDNLEPDTKYYYRAVSTNDNGNTSMAGAYNFTTAEPGPDSFGRLAKWPMYEGFGSIIHDVVNNNDGTITGATWTNGKIGSGLSFDGVNDYVATAKTVNLASTFTLSFWFNSAVETPNRPFGNFNSYNGNVNIESRTDYSLGGFRFRYASSGTGHVISTPYVNDQQWHQIVWVHNAWNGSRHIYSIYTDGVLTGTATTTAQKTANRHTRQLSVIVYNTANNKM